MLTENNPPCIPTKLKPLAEIKQLVNGADRFMFWVTALLIGILVLGVIVAFTAG